MFSDRKFAGERLNWQAAKVKYWKNRAPEIPEGGAVCRDAIFI
jgi:hypothetical protein